MRFAILLALAIALLTPEPIETWAATVPVHPEPAFARVDHVTTTIDRDSSDIYVPILLKPNPHPDGSPVALLLQGANIDKSNYSLFATNLARYGFIVVVPNHLRKFPPIPGLGKDLLLPVQHQVDDVLAYLKGENSDPSSPLFGAIDLNKLMLIGHSMGGIAGLNAIQDQCRPPLCLGRFTRPPELVGGVFLRD